MFHVDHQPIEATSCENLSAVGVVEADEGANEAGVTLEQGTEGRHIQVAACAREAW